MQPVEELGADAVIDDYDELIPRWNGCDAAQRLPRCAAVRAATIVRGDDGAAAASAELPIEFNDKYQHMLAFATLAVLSALAYPEASCSGSASGCRSWAR